MNAASKKRIAVAEANWCRRITISGETRAIVDWLGPGGASNQEISKHCDYTASTIGSQRIKRNIGRFDWVASESMSFESAKARKKRLENSMHLWAKKRPPGMAEFIKEDSWIKMVRYHNA